MDETNVNTWDEFETQLTHVRQAYDKDPYKLPLLFRGQENSAWPLTTTLDRRYAGMLFTEYYRLIHKIKPQIESLTDCDWLIEAYPAVEKLAEGYEDFFNAVWSGRCPGYAYMAYLRHHGFPSPLLDWSRSPHVAAFFAFNKADHTSIDRVAIYVLGEIANKISGNLMPVLHRYGPYVKTHRRHVLQQSEYTLCLGYTDAWRFESYDTVFESGLHQQGLCRKFTIPVSEKSKVLRILDEYNLNAYSLFGSDDSMIETLATREFLLDEK